MYKESFERSLERVREGRVSKEGIGTVKEKSLHAVLKDMYGGHDDNKEIKLGRYIADAVGENGVTEIQTRAMWRLKPKLTELLPLCEVNIVFPIETSKQIIWVEPETGEIVSRTRSTRKMNIYWGLAELADIKPLLKSENLHITFPVLSTEELRLLDGRGNDRKKGATKCDKLPVDMVEEIRINNTFDSSEYKALLPKGLPESFISAEFAALCRLDPKRTQRCLSVLKWVGAIKVTGKKGRAYVYTVE